MTDPDEVGKFNGTADLSGETPEDLGIRQEEAEASLSYGKFKMRIGTKGRVPARSWVTYFCVAVVALILASASVIWLHEAGEGNGWAAFLIPLGVFVVAALFGTWFIGRLMPRHRQRD